MHLRFPAKRALALAACALCVSAAWGQATNSGDIRGIVTDATGAKIPGVTVTVTNIETGITKVLQTNNDGLYDTSSIVVGTYSVKFEKDGFSQFERSSLSLEVGVSTVNASLKVGSTTENVVVNTDLPLLDTESGTQQTTLEAKAMQVLPNVGQDWQNFTILLPGSAATQGGAASSTNPGQEVSANGNLPYSNVLADGASTTLSHSQNSDVNVFETVGELQISTSAFSAQYGIGGIIFNQISKGGTEHFHGSAYDYFQSSQFNAINPNINQTSAAQPPYSHRYNNPGFSVGGPVLLPYVKHKAFFYFNYDQQVNHGANGVSTRDIPTVDIMNGIFPSQTIIYDPTTQTIGHDSNGNAYPIRKSFLSEYGTNAIPTALFDKVAGNFQKYYPTPTNHIATGIFVTGNTNPQTGVIQANFKSAVPGSFPARKYFGRFDFDINQRNRLTISIQQRDLPVVAYSDFTACPIQCQNQDIDSYNPQITEVFSISPRTINEVRLGYTFQGNFYTDEAANKGIAAGLGWQYAKADTIPSIQFTNNYPYSWIGPATNAVYKEHVFDPSDVVTMIRGKHVLHFGGEMLIYQDNSTDWGNQNAGNFQFSGQYTQQWTLDGNGVAHANGSTGADYADFLLGQANNWSANVSPEFGARLKSPQLFIQDDVKLKTNFTLNVGIRYQIRLGWSETHGNEAIYDPTVVNPAGGPTGGFWYGTTKANGRTQLISNSYGTVLPRAGFSWLVHPSTTLRGGFGLYAYNLSLDTYGGGIGALADSSGNYTDPTNGVVAATILAGPGTEVTTNAPLPYTAANNTSAARYNGQSVPYNQYATPNPKIWQWNLDLQQGIGSNTVFELAYVGSHAMNLQFPTDINQTPTNLLPLAAAAGSYQQYRPNQNFQAIGGSTNDGISNYHSLQAQFNRRLARGISFNLNYTWSHFLDDQDSAGWGGGRAGVTTRQYQDAASNYSNSNFDVRNSFKGLIVYELPIGRGRMFLNHNAILDGVLGGYQVSSTMQFHTGTPFTINTQSNKFSDFAGTDSGSSQPFANYTGINITPVGGRTTREWYNPAAFTEPVNGTFGNVRRNSVYGPGLELVNISAGKKFDLYEQVKLQIRLDATNAFNHVSYANPTGSFDDINGAQIQSAQTGARNLQAGVRLEF